MGKLVQASLSVFFFLSIFFLCFFSYCSYCKKHFYHQGIVQIRIDRVNQQRFKIPPAFCSKTKIEINVTNEFVSIVIYFKKQVVLAAMNKAKIATVILISIGSFLAILANIVIIMLMIQKVRLHRVRFYIIINLCKTF